MPTKVELLQALLEVQCPVEFSCGEAKFSMLPFHIFGRRKIHTANEPGCVQITSLSWALDFASGEKKVVLGERPWEGIPRGIISLIVLLVYLLRQNNWLCCPENCWAWWHVNKEIACKITCESFFFCCAFAQKWNGFEYIRKQDIATQGVLFSKWLFCETTDRPHYQHSLIHTSNHVSNCFQNVASPCWLPERSEFPETHRNQKRLEVVKDERWNLKSPHYLF